MNVVNRISDLVIGEEYYVFWGATMYTYVVFLGAINEFDSGNTDLLIAQIKRKKWTSINLPYAVEIGIGKTKAEAKANYAKLKYEDFPNAYPTEKAAKEANEHILDRYE